MVLEACRQVSSFLSFPGDLLEGDITVLVLQGQRVPQAESLSQGASPLLDNFQDQKALWGASAECAISQNRMRDNTQSSRKDPAMTAQTCTNPPTPPYSWPD